jgi:hypothetical protein
VSAGRVVRGSRGGCRRYGFGATGERNLEANGERKEACGNTEPGRRYQARCRNLAPGSRVDRVDRAV